MEQNFVLPQPRGWHEAMHVHMQEMLDRHADRSTYMPICIGSNNTYIDMNFRKHGASIDAGWPWQLAVGLGPMQADSTLTPKYKGEVGWRP